MKTPAPTSCTPPDWMLSTQSAAEKILQKHNISLSLGGEPTFVPTHPHGAEWNYSAVGPQKLGFAQRFAASLIKHFLPGGTAFFSPGKQYPGEANPRWAIRILYPKNHDAPTEKKSPCPTLAELRSALAKELPISADWKKFLDVSSPDSEVWAILLDHDDSSWLSAPWKLKASERQLLPAEGPAGLRLPLHLLPPAITRRSLTIEKKGTSLFIFFPPLLEKPFLQLLAFFRSRHLSSLSKHIHYQGYLPPSLNSEWEVVGIASDPGVLEINIPPCASWLEYATWLEKLDFCASHSGLRSWREDRCEFPCGSGGGNHLVFGAPKDTPNGFYENPHWLASILAYWQSHPSLSYLFTGEYVGGSSQAPRPDESGIPLHELDLALADLRDASSPPTPYFTSENLRHLLIDIAGNPHRAEISIDKFYDPNHPAGLLGLIEFRAIETLPHASWSSAVALLWLALLARLLPHPSAKPLVDFGKSLHDRFFLPHLLWDDFSSVLQDCRRSGMPFEPAIYREIWDWKFPVMWSWNRADATCEIRRAHESWPLLAEVPNEGGSTSRFVDSSLRRIEISANPAFTERFTIFCNGRPIPLLPFSKSSSPVAISGIRYRYANLYPAMHPRRSPQMPLEIQIVETSSHRLLVSASQEAGKNLFQKTSHSVHHPDWNAAPPAPLFPGALTRDLRL